MRRLVIVGLVLAWMGVGCGSGGADCGEGQEVFLGGDTFAEDQFCVYSEEVTDRGGFSCPEKASEVIDRGVYTICSPRSTLEKEEIDEIEGQLSWDLGFRIRGWVSYDSGTSLTGRRELVVLWGVTRDEAEGLDYYVWGKGIVDDGEFTLYIPGSPLKEGGVPSVGAGVGHIHGGWEAGAPLDGKVVGTPTFFAATTDHAIFFKDQDFDPSGFEAGHWALDLPMGYSCLRKVFNSSGDLERAEQVGCEEVKLRVWK